MLSLSVLALLAASVHSEQVFLSLESDSEQWGRCVRQIQGNGVCNRVCALPTQNDGGDCTRADYCRFVADDVTCQVECLDSEDGTDDCYCDASMLGNGSCDIECLSTNSDNGDCVCDLSLLGNGTCNRECMTRENNWDGGDCFTAYARF